MRVDYEQFVVAQAPALLRLAYVLTGDTQRSEDLTQTTLLDAHRRWRRVRAADRPEAYVRQMLVNAHLDWHRRRSSTEVPTDLDPDRATAPTGDHAEWVATRDQLRSLLSNLAPRARAVLVLRYFADLDDREIAEALGITQSTIRATAARALAALRAGAALSLEEER